MNEFIIVPLKKVGEVEFGMARSKVREICGEYKEFKKNKFSKNTTDSFKSFHAYYDANDKCEAIEFFEKVTLKINDIAIFPATYKEVCGYLKKIDKNIKIEEDGCISCSESISIYAPSGDVESILFAVKGYFD